MAFNMTMKKPGKKYGLQPKKKLAASAFGAHEEEDDEEESMSAQEQVNHAILQAQASEARKKKAQATYDQALAEDSSVFEYDGVYDIMQEKREPPFLLFFFFRIPSPSRGFGRSLAFAELLQGRLFGVRLLWTELRRSSLCAACQPRPVVASAAQTACPISMSRPSRASAHANSTWRHFPGQ